MPRPITDIQADILRVTQEIASPSREIHYNQKGMTRRTTDEAIKALETLQAEYTLANALALNPAGTRIRQIRLFGSSGL